MCFIIIIITIITIIVIISIISVIINLILHACTFKLYKPCLFNIHCKIKTCLIPY